MEEDGVMNLSENQPDGRVDEEIGEEDADRSDDVHADHQMENDVANHQMEEDGMNLSENQPDGGVEHVGEELGEEKEDFDEEIGEEDADRSDDVHADHQMEGDVAADHPMEDDDDSSNDSYDSYMTPPRDGEEIDHFDVVAACEYHQRRLGRKGIVDQESEVQSCILVVLAWIRDHPEDLIMSDFIISRILVSQPEFVSNDSRRAIVEIILTRWGKAPLLKRVREALDDSEPPDFFQLETIKELDLLATFVTLLGIGDERAHQGIIFCFGGNRKVDRKKFRSEWTSMDMDMEDCGSHWVKNLILGRVDSPAGLACSKFMTEFLLYEYVYEGLDYDFLSATFNHLWVQPLKVLSKTYNTEPLGFCYLIEEMVQALVPVIEEHRMEGVKMFDSLIECMPLSVRFTETRERLLRRLAQTMGGMEGKVREATKLILIKILKLCWDDPNQNVELIQEVEGLIGFRSSVGSRARKIICSSSGCWKSRIVKC